MRPDWFMRNLAMALVGVLVMFGTLFVATPAQAAPGCYTWAICFHNTSTSSPNHWRDGEDSGPGECHNISGSANNTASYITNRTDYRWYVYPSPGCLDWAGTIYANSAGPMAAPYNNSISSYRRG